jgi:hypothetical protein
MATLLTPSLPICSWRRRGRTGHSTSIRLDSIPLLTMHPWAYTAYSWNWITFTSPPSRHASERKAPDRLHKRYEHSASRRGTGGQSYGRCSTVAEVVTAGVRRYTHISNADTQAQTGMECPRRFSRVLTAQETRQPAHHIQERATAAQTLAQALVQRSRRMRRLLDKMRHPRQHPIVPHGKCDSGRVGGGEGVGIFLGA